MPAKNHEIETLEQFLSYCQQRIQSVLQQALSSSTQHSEKLQKAMAYACLDGGKRVRPVLVYAAAMAGGSEMKRADKAAAAVELVHCYSLVHDDLPAMDDDDLRRGKPTVHKAFDEATAILAGDALLTLAFKILADSGQEGIPAHDCLAMVRTLASAAGHKGMIAGQAMDFESVGKALDAGQLEAMHGLKTGALISASVEMGALCSADLPAGQREALRRYAGNVGLAFQIQDDILDVIGDTDTIGKPQGSDKSLDKPTYSSILGLDAARARAVALAETAVNDLEVFDQSAEMLRKLALFVVERIH